MSRERRTFEPDSIRESLQLNLVDGLRAIADAVERGELQARLVSALTNGWGPINTANVVVSVKLTAEMERSGSGTTCRVQPPQIYLPAPPPSLAMQPGAGGQQQ